MISATRTLDQALADIAARDAADPHWRSRLDTKRNHWCRGRQPTAQPPAETEASPQSGAAPRSPIAA